MTRNYRTLTVRNKGRTTTIPIFEDFFQSFSEKFSYLYSHGFILEFKLQMESELPEQYHIPYLTVFDTGEFKGILENPEHDCLVAMSHIFNNIDIDFDSGYVPDDVKYIIMHVHNVLTKYHDEQGHHFNMFLINCDQWECKGYLESAKK